MKLANLKMYGKRYGVKENGRKVDIIQAIINSGCAEKVAEHYKKEIIMPTDTMKELLEEHNYIPYLVSYLHWYPLLYKSIYEHKERNPDASITETIAAGIDIDHIAEWYLEYCEPEELEFMRSEAKQDAKETAEEICRILEYYPPDEQQKIPH